MSNSSFEGTNNQIFAGKVEKEAFLNSNINSDNQITKINDFNKKIKGIEDKIVEKEISLNSSNPDYITFRLGQDIEELNDSLDSLKYERDTLIKEKIERIPMSLKNKEEINRIENLIKKYSYSNINESLISKIARLNEEIKIRTISLRKNLKLSLRAKQKIEEEIEELNEMIIYLTALN